MKLYVWEGDGVLEDYSTGMIVALAPDLEGALAAIRSACDYCMKSFPTDRPTEVIDLGHVTAEPKAWLTWGGG